ncbi:E3 ubiquitin-protein ligase ZSWIM2-like [Clarias magur]|uniref:E3 ubiquitin-protein ligase ZSWIM2-like n=1 Tax=Clarias magur TaxID=1594786 RepID=A0A8J4THQ1_CLAMG|nr:E3 ubiquitin-protein ligase ZSWIM2-like [Clarias magur]
MIRKRVWRKAASEAVKRHQDESLNTTMFLLKEFGPTGFLLQEDGEPKNYKVFLGDPHTCTCGTFNKEKDLCKHLCWVLMRKFRLPRNHEYCFQTGLVERQILEVLQHPFRTDSVPSAPAQVCSVEEDDGTMRQKDIRDDDICPICQEELLRKRLPVAHCRFGCGNNVHVSCVRLWADHQTSSETTGMVKCPLCRENFSTTKMLRELVKNASRMCTSSERERLEKHLGIPCNSCRICPVAGKCFKCTVCSYYHLCEDCFRRRSHPQHSFAVRMAWLQRSDCCPVDWHVIYNPLTWSGNDNKVTTIAPPTGGAQKKQNFELFGVGLQRKERSDVPQALGRNTTSTQRCLSLEQASGKRTGPKTSCPSLSSSPVVGTQQGLIVRFSRHDSKARREVSSLHGRIRPEGLDGDAAGVRTRRSNRGGHQSDLDLQPRIFPIGANRVRKD